MGDFAQEKHAPIRQPVMYPPPETGFGFGGVLAADGRVLFSTNKLYVFEDNFERSFNPGRVDHFIGLAGVRCEKCGIAHGRILCSRGYLNI